MIIHKLKYSMKKLLLIAALVASCVSARAELRLRNVFSDGMVLQQKSQAAIWGTADKGATVKVQASWSDTPVSCKADNEGKWKLTIPTPDGSYETRSITVTSGKEKITVNNVLIGEVWLGSGQSNMEMMMDGSEYGYVDCPVRDAVKYIAQAPADNKIRMFTVPRNQTYDIQEDVEAQWRGANPQTIARMSATSYFFARKLNEMLDVPVGMIVCAFGGARVESWIPQDILQTYPDEDLSKEHIDKMFFMHKPFMAYNAMLAPMRGYTIKGFIWYQGCSNIGKDQQYAGRLSDMVARWRKEWGDNDASLPFYQVEIAPCTQHSPLNQAAELRQAQHDAARLIPNCSIIVTNDLLDEYEKWNIHPSLKEPVGDRLAYLALNRDYGFTGIPCYSPEAVGATLARDGKNIVLELTEVSPLGVNREQGITGLEVRDSEGNWHKTSEVQFSNWTKQLTVKCDGIEGVTAIRYGWGDYAPGNLKNIYGLPVTPFNIEVKRP